MSFKSKKAIIFGIIFLIFIFPYLSLADEYGQKQLFNVDQNYDALGRERIFAILIKVSQNAYFYIDEDYWAGLLSSQKEEVANHLKDLANEFDTKIYPSLTSAFGFETKPGIDGDSKITVLLHQMKGEVGGYFREGDCFEKFQYPLSNQREMVYLNLNFLKTSLIKPNLSHEFLHLITFNQKNKILKVQEETWLNELRAEIAPTLLGYPDYLQKRVSLFLKNPQDALLDWQNTTADYGVVSIFANYLYDYYGSKIFIDSIRSRETGILAVNEALKKSGFKEDFSQIFRNWLIATLVNDCALGEKYCYQNQNLKSLRVLPEINFSPMGGESILTIFRTVKDFTPDWQKIVGGYGNLTLEFDGQNNALFDISYLTCDKFNSCQIKFLTLDQNQDGKISILDFDKNYSSLTLIPFSKTKTSGFDKENPYYNYSIKIAFNKKIEVKPSTSSVPTTTPTTIGCNQILNNLRYGMKSNEVRCLQEFLRSQGTEIYPEGLVTGYFGPLTFSAVKRFQQKYWQEILSPWGLNQNQPTGFVGSTTRAKINTMIGG